MPGNPGGWDANRDGVMEGVQHNTYDVEFYGPNPLCGIYYLAALRACEEMARAVGESDFSADCHRLFENGSRWLDANLFNGRFYEQQVRSFHNNEIAASLRSDMGADDPEHPEYQVGEGCLVDQLLGQSLAEVCGLGPLLDEKHIRRTLESIYKYNYKRSLANHDNVQRTFVLNDESALVVCDYAGVQRPRIPFPYFAEVFTGLEYPTAAHMIFAGMVNEGVECITNVRHRYDGERRNPWDEAECGHHYARAMSAWSGILAISGFRYNAPDRSLSVQPRTHLAEFRCFWSTGTGWGIFTQRKSRLELKVHSGQLPLAAFSMNGVRGGTRALLNGKSLDHKFEGGVFHLSSDFAAKQGDTIVFEGAA